MLDSYEDVLTVNDICKILRIGKNSAYDLLKNGTIPCKKLRSKYIIPKVKVIDFLQAI